MPIGGKRGRGTGGGELLRRLVYFAPVCRVLLCDARCTKVGLSERCFFLPLILSYFDVGFYTVLLCVGCAFYT